MELYLRYALEFAVALPAAVFAALPVREHLRFRPAVAYSTALAVVGVLVFGGAWLCVRNAAAVNWVLLPVCAVLLGLYCACVDLALVKRLFCFFTAFMLGVFCTTYTGYLTAPLETGEKPFTFESGAVCMGLAVVVGALFWRTLTVRLPYLFEIEKVDYTWRFFVLVPLLLTVLSYWMTPLHPQMVLLGRVRKIALVIMLVVPLAFYAFCYLFWWLTKSLTESTRLQEENNLLQMEQKRYKALQSYPDLMRGQSLRGNGEARTRRAAPRTPARPRRRAYLRLRNGAPAQRHACDPDGGRRIRRRHRFVRRLDADVPNMDHLLRTGAAYESGDTIWQMKQGWFMLPTMTTTFARLSEPFSQATGIGSRTFRPANCCLRGLTSPPATS